MDDEHRVDWVDVMRQADWQMRQIRQAWLERRGLDLADYLALAVARAAAWERAAVKSDNK